MTPFSRLEGNITPVATEAAIGVIFYKKGVLWNFTIFTGKHLCCRLKRDCSTGGFLWILPNF